MNIFKTLKWHFGELFLVTAEKLIRAGRNLSK